MDTVIIELTTPKTMKLILELEELHLLRVLKKNIKPDGIKLSEKYKGFISKEEGLHLDNHINQMRDEWNNI
jgi:hypothetical protein